MVTATTKRAALVGLVFFVAMIIYVWQSHLVHHVESFLPPVLHHSKPPPLPVHHEIRCPVGFGESMNAKSLPLRKNSSIPHSPDQKETEFIQAPKVVALVFFGRRATVSVLDCYLKVRDFSNFISLPSRGDGLAWSRTGEANMSQRNLVKNGGLLDEVIFVERTGNEEDLALLNRLLESEPSYSRHVIDMDKASGFGSSYEMVEDDVLYIKIDDDIVSRTNPSASLYAAISDKLQVFIEDDAIPSIVCTKLTRPDFYIVSANVVNQPMISWIHWNLDAVKPYLPEVDKEYPAPEHGHQVNWRASALPAWEGNKDQVNASFWNSPDEKKHRWLPIREKSDHVLDKTPIVETQYDAFGTGLARWQIAAQEHYSFLEALEKNELWSYKFNIWDFQRNRMGIQFVALLGRDINAAKPISNDDEDHFAVAMPRKHGKSKSRQAEPRVHFAALDSND